MQCIRNIYLTIFNGLKNETTMYFAKESIHSRRVRGTLNAFSSSRTSGLIYSSEGTNSRALAKVDR